MGAKFIIQILHCLEHNTIVMLFQVTCYKLYADDIIIFSESASGLQNGLNILHDYCQKLKLTVNVDKSKVMVFRKGGRLAQNLVFMYGDINLEIVKKFNYLGIVFTPGGSFSEAQATLSGQALKAIFAMNRYLNNFVHLKPSHILDLFDKLISPILNYRSEVWGFAKADNIERVHLQFCKKTFVCQTVHPEWLCIWRTW